MSAVLRRVTVGQLAKDHEQVKNKIHESYVQMGKLIRKLEDFKRKRGVCTVGLSCMKFAVGKGSRKGKVMWCEDHHPRKWIPTMREKTPFGLLMAAERLDKSKRKAAAA